jgi:23S rRNA pseudouridine2605 synthase
MLYHKPVGIHSTIKDPWGRKNLEDVIQEHEELKPYHPVGRLDADSSGLLLFSRDGELTQRLLHPSSRIMREYDAIVIGHVPHDDLKARLANGIKTSDGVFSLSLLKSSYLDESSVATLRQKITRSMDLDDPAESKEWSKETITSLEDGKLSLVTVACSEGKYRMVRRVLHNANHSVLALHRTRYGNISLSSLPEGAIRVCNHLELEWLRGLIEK